MFAISLVKWPSYGLLIGKIKIRSQHNMFQGSPKAKGGGAVLQLQGGFYNWGGSTITGVLQLQGGSAIRGVLQLQGLCN